MIHGVTPKADLRTAPVREGELAETLVYKTRAAGKQSDSDPVPSVQIDRAEIDRVVQKAGEVVESIDPRLKFEIDDDTERVVVKIVNRESGEIIRQFPPEEVLELDKYLSGLKGLLLEERA